MVKRFQLKKGVDFDEIFAPVVKMTSIRTVLRIVTSMDLEVKQLDVKTAVFLHGDLEEEIYMQQPEGKFGMSIDEVPIWAEASTQQWYRKFDSFMLDHGFHQTQANHCFFVKKYDGEDFLILMLYVEDMLIVRQNLKKISSLKKALGKAFAMKDMGMAKQILGMHIVRNREKKLLWLSQEKYVTKVP